MTDFSLLDKYVGRKVDIHCYIFAHVNMRFIDCELKRTDTSNFYIYEENCFFYITEFWQNIEIKETFGRDCKAIITLSRG